jgi:hypothetical protein
MMATTLLRMLYHLAKRMEEDEYSANDASGYGLLWILLTVAPRL